MSSSSSGFSSRSRAWWSPGSASGTRCSGQRCRSREPSASTSALGHTSSSSTGSGQRHRPLTITRDDGVTIDASQLRVTAANGRPVRVRNSSPDETISRNSDTYTSAVEFTTPRAGDYLLRFRTPDRGQVMVRRPLGDLLRRAIPWLLEIAAGGVLALAGVAMLIVGAVRRGRTPHPALTGPVSTGTAAAWYPDPSGLRRLRYWGGTQWTDHTAD